MPDFLTRAEYDNLREDIRNSHIDLKADMAEGFEAITARLKEMNGTQRHHGDRLTVLETVKGRLELGTILAIGAVVVSIWSLFR